MRVLLLLLLTAGLGGCASTVPRRAPIDASDVAAALRAPDPDAVRAAVTALHHPYLRPADIDLRDGVSPDEAALVAVVASPALRATRAQRGVAQAEVIAAGVLPNPQLSVGADLPLPGQPGESVGFAFGLDFDLSALFTRPSEVRRAEAARAALDLDIAWAEWETAAAARLLAFRGAFLAREAEYVAQQEADLTENLRVLTGAVARHLALETDRAAAEDALFSAHTARLDLELQRDTTRLALLRTMGFPPGATLTFQRTGVPFLPGALDTLGGDPPLKDGVLAPDPYAPAICSTA